MCANDCDAAASRCKVDERGSCFGCEAFALVNRRDAVGNLYSSVGIWRTGESAQPDHDVVDLVHNGKTELPRIGRSRGTKFRNEVTGRGEKKFLDAVRNAHSGSFLVLLAADKQGKEMRRNVRVKHEAFCFCRHNEPRRDSSTSPGMTTVAGRAPVPMRLTQCARWKIRAIRVRG